MKSPCLHFNLKKGFEAFFPALIISFSLLCIYTLTARDRPVSKPVDPVDVSPQALESEVSSTAIPSIKRQEPELFLPEIVASAIVEMSLTLSPDSQSLFFARKDSFYVMGGKNTVYQSDLKNGKWTKPRVASFSGEYSDSSPFISPDGNRLFFTSDRPFHVGGEKKDRDIWYVERRNKNWSAPIRLLAANSKESEYGPSIDKEGNLYFGSYREGGLGSGDLWVSYFKDGQYLPPINLGEAINTRGGEWSGCISPEGDYFIFEASGRRENITNSGDLYISYRQNDVWTKARHLGDLNSEGSDLTPKIHGDYLYFSSNRHEDFVFQMNNNNVDVYRIALKDLKNFLRD